MHTLVTENEELRVKLGLTPPRSPSQDYTCLTRKITSSCHDNVITPTVNDHANIVIKQEELPATEHASLKSDSQQWSLAVAILFYMITILALAVQR